MKMTMDNKLKIKCLSLGAFETNCYIVWRMDEGSCILIDPADGGPQIVAGIEQLAVVPTAIFLTHGHFDHILAVPYLQKRWPSTPVYCHKYDCPIEPTEEYMGAIYPTVSTFSNLVYYQEDGQQIDIGSFSVQILHTPGHTPGSVTVQVDKALFTGDTLFKRDIGRTDFEGGNPSMMMRSLAKLMKLPGDYRVFPGHDAPTTLEEERKQNPYLKSIQKRLL